MIPNFAKVDATLWRGGRPDEAGARWLVAEGAHTVVNLEWEQEDDDVFGYAPTVRFVRVKDFEPLPWFAPSVSDHHVRRFLAVVRSGQAPIYVHCRSGENRTGVMVAAYQMIVKGAPLADVLDEFDRYRGFWAWGDARYVRGLARRRASFR